jgi:hypothetical protein
MPIYAMKCPCGHTEDIVRTVARMNEDLPEHCGQPMSRMIVAPMVAADIQPYRSMCDGSMITSRSQHREHLRRHGVVEVGNEKLPDRVSTLGKAGDIKRDVAEIVNAKL